MKYEVIFSINGSVRTVVEAEDEDEAEKIAREKLDDGFDVDDAEIDECWDVREVK